MGIRKLLQDLYPYAERVVLGAPLPGDTEISSIKTLIIDGPTLVYFVYNKLQQYHSATSSTTAAVSPTYEEINNGVLYLLHDLEKSGVSILDIFFDGGLPDHKREVRLERMEMLRRQMETFKNAHPDFPPFATFVESQSSEQVLWDPTTTLTRKSTLPPPPFMVASTIEALRTRSRWQRRVQVVPGEADMYCALAARKSTECVAVLTSDSDLAVHDLGEKGQVVLVNSLEKGSRDTSTKHSWITTLRLAPRQIAVALGIPSLLALGFERFSDPNGSLAVLLNRARDESRRFQVQDQYLSFAEQYLPSTAIADVKLDGLDPRTAEMIVDGHKSAVTVYLTPVVEDPQRDSSWWYGEEIRQLAYSLVATVVFRRSTVQQYPIVNFIEYARKGQRIAPTLIAILTPVGIIKRAAQLQSLFDRNLPDLTLSADTTLELWHLLAFRIVCQQKNHHGKSMPTEDQILRLFRLARIMQHSRTSYPEISWDDMHLLACTQAVLYSLRMLHQITGYILTQYEPVANASRSDDDQKLLGVVRNLREALSRMSTIADLFIDLPRSLQRLTGEPGNLK